MEYIGLITTSIPQSPPEGYVVINIENLDPVLQHSVVRHNPDGTSTLSWTTIDGTDDDSRASQLSDIEFQLRQRSWNIGPRIYINTSGGLYLYLGEVGSPIPQIYSGTPDGVSISEIYTQAGADEFNEYYEKLMNIKPVITMDGTEIDLSSRKYYSSLVSSRDILDGVSVVDLIALGGTAYTNILNLSELLHLSPIDPSKFLDCDCSIKLGVTFTKSGKNYTRNIMFEPFVVLAGELKVKEFTRTIADSVVVEYSDKCIRVFPVATDPTITECVISQCYFSYYGGLI